MEERKRKRQQMSAEPMSEFNSDAMDKRWLIAEKGTGVGGVVKGIVPACAWAEERGIHVREGA